MCRFQQFVKDHRLHVINWGFRVIRHGGFPDQTKTSFDCMMGNIGSNTDSESLDIST